MRSSAAVVLSKLINVIMLYQLLKVLTVTMCNYSRHDTLSARTWDTDHWILSSFQHYLHQWMHASLVFVVLFFFFARNHSLVFVDNFELVFHLINVNQGFVTANIFRSLVICIWIHFGVEYVTSKKENYTTVFCLLSPTLYLS
jgi:hypothetical protein